MSFQADALSSPCDLLDFRVPRFDWLRPLSSEHQLENLSESNSKNPSLDSVCLVCHTFAFIRVPSGVPRNLALQVGQVSETLLRIVPLKFGYKVRIFHLECAFYKLKNLSHFTHHQVNITLWVGHASSWKEQLENREIRTCWKVLHGRSLSWKNVSKIKLSNLKIWEPPLVVAQHNIWILKSKIIQFAIKIKLSLRRGWFHIGFEWRESQQCRPKITSNFIQWRHFTSDDVISTSDDVIGSADDVS